MHSPALEVYYDRDARPALLAGRTVAVIGYGSQGHAQAQNLRDSGVDVVVAELPGTAAHARAVADGFAPLGAAEAAQRAAIVHLLLPDPLQPEVYAEAVAPALRAGQALVFSHGFNIHFRQIVPPPGVDVYMVAPKGIGPQVRRTYCAGGGVPALIAIHQDATGDAHALALAHACALGCGRTGIIETTFAEETETDLFGEQAVLCGGLTELIRAGFDTLVAAGYRPEVAYFECLHEVKLIADLVHERGITGMRAVISGTAAYGDVTRGRRVITADTRRAMAELLAEIRSGAFAEEWVAEHRAGGGALRARLEQDAAHPIEELGAALRAMFSGAPRR